MNKIAKGAIATGVGVILLAGGSGTLATWNQSQNASLGQIASGDLNLTAAPGVWTNGAGTVIPVIGDYRVVPGDTLTFTQPLTVTLSGNLMSANLAATNTSGSAFAGKATVSATELTRLNTHGTPVTTDDTMDVVPATGLTQADSGAVTAKTTFKFNTSTIGRDAANLTHVLGTVGYALTQVAPVPANNQ